jgi:hypothetical protein
MTSAALSVQRCIGLCALSIVVCLVAGCGGGGGGGAAVATGAPVISQFRATTPSGLSRDGGYVSFQAVVSDDVAVSTVVATVTGPNGGSSSTTVTLSPTTLTVFLGVFAAPAITTGRAEEYTVVLRATDDSGNTAAPKTITFVVPDVPPPPPI